MAKTPQAEAVRRNIAVIQQGMATGGLATIASHFLQLDLITGQNYRDSLASCGKGPDDQAAMLMSAVESRIRNSPDVYFTKLIEALRRSNLGYVADRLEQALLEHQCKLSSRAEPVHRLCCKFLVVTSLCMFCKVFVLCIRVQSFVHDCIYGLKGLYTSVADPGGAHRVQVNPPLPDIACVLFEFNTMLFTFKMSWHVTKAS